MGRIRIEDFHGLYTWGGIRRRPQGTVFQGTNYLAEAPGVIRSRPGVARSENGATSSILSVHPMGLAPTTASVVDSYDGSLSYLGTTGAVTSIAAAGAFSAVGDYASYGNRTKSARALQNLYLTSSLGIRRLLSDWTTLAHAGMCRGMAYRQRDSAAPGNQLVGGTGLLANLAARAYRFTVHTLDRENTEISGPPSGRMVILNDNGTTGHTGGALDPVPACLLPRQLGTTTALTTSFYLRTWGSRTSAAGTPDDEMFLIDEHQVTAGDIAAGYYKFTDSMSDAILVTGPRLHTNLNDYQPPEPITAKGVVNEDAHPPKATDIASWRGRTWFGGIVQEWPTKPLVMLTIPANLDTITINGYVLTFKNAPAGAADIQIEAGYSASRNIEATAENLVDCINKNTILTTATARGMGDLTGNTFPGQLQLEATTAAGTLTVAVSAAAKWKIGVVPPTALNSLAFSKLGRPDASAPVNRITWTDDVAVLPWRIVPLRDFLYVFSTKGIHRISGTDATNFSAELFDSTALLVGPQCIAIVDDRIYAWCTQGICAIDATGVEWISQPIEPTLINIAQTISTTNPIALSYQAFAAPWQNKHRVSFWYPTTAFSNGTPLANLNCTKALVYDTRTREWSHWTDSNTGFCCASDNRITSPIYGDSTNPDGAGYLWTYNPGTALTDFQDQQRAAGPRYTTVATTIGLCIQAPEGVSAPHWQEIAVAVERDLINTALVPCPSMTATFYSVDLSTSVTVTGLAADQSDYRRFVVPQAYRSQPTLLVMFGSNTEVARLGIECVDIYYGDVAKGVVRT